jgi:hypothetical protein
MNRSTIPISCPKSPGEVDAHPCYTDGEVFERDQSGHRVVPDEKLFDVDTNTGVHALDLNADDLEG